MRSNLLSRVRVQKAIEGISLPRELSVQKPDRPQSPNDRVQNHISSKVSPCVIVTFYARHKPPNLLGTGNLEET